MLDGINQVTAHDGGSMPAYVARLGDQISLAEDTQAGLQQAFGYLQRLDDRWPSTMPSRLLNCLGRGLKRAAWLAFSASTWAAAWPSRSPARGSKRRSNMRSCVCWR